MCRKSDFLKFKRNELAFDCKRMHCLNGLGPVTKEQDLPSNVIGVKNVDFSIDRLVGD